MHIILNIKNDEYLKREKVSRGRATYLDKIINRIKNYFI